MARLAGVYGFPREGKRLPGLLQIHGGGQSAHENACLANAKHGYATLSIAWAGRIAASKYGVHNDIIKLFWEGRTNSPHYKLTTDWGALDAYHAPARNPGNQFPSAQPAAWTLDAVESPRNSGWFLCALAARRALTFLERQPEVDANRLGVYGHSMGGKLTVLTASDSRVKAAAPSCGGISDRYNKSDLFRQTLGDDVNLREISCPIIFLSPANDFHGRIGDLSQTVKDIQSESWRATCSPHHNHQDTPSHEVATLLWFDEHLKREFKMPATPRASLTLTGNRGVPTLAVIPDTARAIESVDVFYTQHGKPAETPLDRVQVMHRFWHHAKPTQADGYWVAELPIGALDQTLWAYANVRYKLDEPVSGAGYYYGNYTATNFTLSSRLQVASPEELREAEVQATLEATRLIESFEGDWEKEWFTYKPHQWARSTHKLFDTRYQAPEGEVKLAMDVQAKEKNELVILLDEFVVVIPLNGSRKWQPVTLSPGNFKSYSGKPLSSWRDVKRLKLSAAERLRPGPGESGKSRIMGRSWKGESPRFRNLRWVAADDRQ